VTTVVCVLKTGKFTNQHFTVQYAPRHVRWLRDQFAKHLPGAPFVCLTDVAVATVDCEPLRHDWPGWWSKMELFRFQGPLLYVDLDTVIVGSMAQIAALPQPGDFWAMSSLFRREGIMNSGLMAWNGDFRFLYEVFAADPQRHMRECVTPSVWGDQGFIQRELRAAGRAWKPFQAAVPHQVISVKADLKLRLPPPPSARVVCFHGIPKPWDAKMRWIPGLGD
jgi:hypothetical protein